MNSKEELGHDLTWDFLQPSIFIWIHIAGIEMVTLRYEWERVDEQGIEINIPEAENYELINNSWNVSRLIFQHYPYQIYRGLSESIDDWNFSLTGY